MKKYTYHIVNNFESLPQILKQYNMSLDLFVQLNKVRYPHLIENPYLIFEGYLLVVPNITSFKETE